MEATTGSRRTDTCDVVVVGAGIVGAAVAVRIARFGMQVAVLDAQKVAGGATGRSAGMVVAGLPGHYRRAVKAFGREQARTLWALTIEGRERLAESANRVGVTLERVGSLAVAVTEEEVETLRASAELLREDGFDAWFGTTDPLGRGFLATLRQPDDGVVDVAELTRALLSSAPIAVHTDTEVYELEPTGEGVRVWAQGRNVRCGRVVLTVDGYASLLDPALSQWVTPGRALIVTTEPLAGAGFPIPCYANYGHKYACPLPDGRWALGAWWRPRPGAAPIEPDQSLREGLGRFITRYFPEVRGRIAGRRSGVMGFTSDGIPVVGRLPPPSPVVFALGFGGWGLSWAFVAAERLVEWILQDTDPGILSVERLTGNR
ncbi:MAG TPA: FAD-binding oxidoreductase [Anaerolineales bacterium]|nr:FAD-binding oxidoreductase [Anaerolineales bacterium]